MKRQDCKYLLFILALSLVACGSDDAQEQEPASAPLAVRFTTTVPGYTTRNAINSNADLQREHFGVFAYYTGTADYEATDAPNFMNNQQVTYDADWTYSPVKYWPNNVGDKVTFLAYAPYKSSGVSASNEPVVSYTWVNNVNPASQEDLLYDNTQTNKVRTASWPDVTSRVSFSFRHALAAIQFKVRRKEATGSAVSLRVGDGSQVLTLVPTAAMHTSGSFNVATASWSGFTNTTPTIAYTGSDVASGLLSAGSVTAVTDETAHPLSQYSPGYVLMMPQVEPLSFTVTLNYRIGSTDYSTPSTLTFSDGLDMNTRYTVVFVIDGNVVDSYVLREREAEQW